MSGKNPVVPLGSPPASESEFKIFTAEPEVRFLSRAVQPPSQLYVEKDDVLEVHCSTSAPSESVIVSYRLLRYDGQITKGQFQVSPTQYGAVKIYQEPMTEGFLLSVAIIAKQATQRGVTFVRIFLASTSLGVGVPSYMLMADYATTAASPAYPFGRVTNSEEGTGDVANLTVAVPPVGTDWSLTVPPITLLKVRSVYAGLVTSAVAASRLVKLFQFQQGANCFIGSASSACPQSITRFFGGNGQSPWPDMANDCSSIPFAANLAMLSGDKIGVVTENLQAGDQWGPIQIGVESWIANG